MHKNGNNANIGIRGFISWKQKSQLQNATLVSIEPLDLWFQVQHTPLYTNLAFACKTETLSSLYSHALLSVTKSSKSKHQVVHEQKFKGLLSSRNWTIQSFFQVFFSFSCSGSILTGVTFCYWNFLFLHSQASDANIGIIANFV